MIDLTKVEEQLKQVGVNFKLWGSAEKRELCHILTENEKIVAALNGRYEGGFAMLVATDQRLLLIDKKPWFLTMEDIRYDMIAEVDYSSHLLEASVQIMTFNKTLFFRSINKRHLRPLTSYVQNRVMEMRTHGYNYGNEMQAMPASPQPMEAHGAMPQLADDTYPAQPAVPAYDAHGMTPQQVDDSPPSPVMPEVAFDKPFLPRFRPVNPYTRSSVMMRRRLSRF